MSVCNQLDTTVPLSGCRERGVEFKGDSLLKFMTVLAVLESTLPSSRSSYKNRIQRQQSRFWRFLAVFGGCGDFRRHGYPP